MKSVKKPALVVLVLLLIISTSITLNLLAKTFDEPKQLAYKQTKPFTYKEYDNIEFNIEYTNDRSLNDALNRNIETIFNDNIDIFINKDKIIKAKLALNNAKNIVSWTFVEETENFSEVFGTLIFNTINEEVISFDKIYGDNLKGLSMLVRSALAKDETLLYNQKTYTKTTPEIANFKYLTFAEDGVELLFKRDTFGQEMIKKIKLAYAEIMPYFSDDFLTVLDNNYVKPQLGFKRYIDPNKPMVAMTFDDGPNNKTSTDLSEYYAKRDSRLTYFWLGSRIEAFPEIVLKIHNQGHEIANHSYDHQDYTKLDDQQLNKQTAYVTKQIKDITKQEKVLLRPPYGRINDALKEKIDNPLIMWKVDPEDWKHRDSKVVYNSIDKYIYDGSIVLMHDLYPTSVAAAQKILDDFSDTYQFVTVSEMFAYKGIALENGQIYYEARGR